MEIQFPNSNNNISKYINTCVNITAALFTKDANMNSFTEKCQLLHIINFEQNNNNNNTCLTALCPGLPG